MKIDRDRVRDRERSGPHRRFRILISVPVSISVCLSALSPLFLALSLFTALLFALGSPSEAQQAKIPRIGLLSSASEPLVEAFRSGLRELGYVDGKNITIEFRFSEGRVDRFRDHAADMVRLKVNIIVTGGTGATFAASEITKVIPIVMTVVGDPVESGFVASLARPGGNITGLTTISPELGGKRLEILRETFPRVSLVAVLWNPDNPGSSLQFRETQLAAQALGVHLESLQVREPNDFDKAFQTITNKPATALVVLRGALTNFHTPRIVEFAAKRRLPAMFSRSGSAEAGGLMFYGTDDRHLYRRAATYVDRILKGAKPADLPVEQPTKFELVINLKTANQIGLTIPPNVLARADKVIR